MWLEVDYSYFSDGIILKSFNKKYAKRLHYINKLVISSVYKSSSGNK
jgi:hypothetical protein